MPTASGAFQGEKMKVLQSGIAILLLPQVATVNSHLVATAITALAQTLTPSTKELAACYNVTLTAVDSTVAFTGGTMTVMGRDQNGKPVSEVHTYVGAGLYTGNVAFSYVEKVLVVLTGAIAGTQTISIGNGSKLGLPVGIDGELVNVFKALHAGVLEAVGVFNRTYATIIPTSASGGDHSQCFFFTYKSKLFLG